jgi:hypothetical protein
MLNYLGTSWTDYLSFIVDDECRLQLYIPKDIKRKFTELSWPLIEFKFRLLAENRTEYAEINQIIEFFVNLMSSTGDLRHRKKFRVTSSKSISNVIGGEDIDRTMCKLYDLEIRNDTDCYTREDLITDEFGDAPAREIVVTLVQMN